MQEILDVIVFIGIGYFAYYAVKKGAEYDEEQEKKNKDKGEHDNSFFFFWRL